MFSSIIGNNRIFLFSLAFYIILFVYHYIDTKFGIEKESCLLPSPLIQSNTYEPCHKKTCLRGFRPGQTQIGLYNHRRRLEA